MTRRALLVLGLCGAALGGVRIAAAGVGADGLVGVIVALEAAPLARYRGTLPGLPAPRAAGPRGARLSAQSAASRAYLAHLEGELAAFEVAARGVAPAMRVLYRHRAVVGGVSLRVPAGAVDALARLPRVRAVYRDGLAELATERSGRFVGADRVWSALGGPASAGEGVVVAVLDTGVWPEHPSFADPDPHERPYPAPPASWNGGAGPECQAPPPAIPACRSPAATSWSALSCFSRRTRRASACCRPSAIRRATPTATARTPPAPPPATPAW